MGGAFFLSVSRPVFLSEESGCALDDWNDGMAQGLNVCKLCCKIFDESARPGRRSLPTRLRCRFPLSPIIYAEGDDCHDGSYRIPERYRNRYSLSRPPNDWAQRSVIDVRSLSGPWKREIASGLLLRCLALFSRSPLYLLYPAHNFSLLPLLPSPVGRFRPPPAGIRSLPIVNV